MDRKIKDMLVFSKSQEIVKSNCCIKDLVAKLNLFIDANQNKNITCNVAECLLNTQVNCNQAMLIDAVGNCLENSQNAGAKNVSLDISLQESNLKIVITDDGAGIPTHLQKKVLNPFFTTREAGTGLGLAVTKMVVDAHAGELQLQSTPGKGTSISLVIPIRG